MVEVTAIFISKIIQIILVLVLLRGIFIIAKSLKEMEEKYSKPMILLIISLIMYVLLAISFSLLLYQKTDYESYLWLLPPIIGLTGSFILVIGGRKLFEAITAPEEEPQKKI